MFWTFTLSFDEYELEFFGLATVFGYFVKTVGEFFLNLLVTLRVLQINLVPYYKKRLFPG
jgi:hypothetical protein